MAYYNFAGDLSDITRGSLMQEYFTYPIKLSDLRVFDAFGTVLPATPGSDDLGLVGGTVGTHCILVKSTTASGTSITQKARFTAYLPAEYVSGGVVKLRVRAKVEVAANVSNTVDLSAYETDGTLSADLVTTSAQALTTSFADYDFVVTSTSLVAGDELDVLLTFAADDTGATNACIVNIASIKLYCAVKG